MQRKSLYGFGIVIPLLFMFSSKVQAAETGLVQQNGQWIYIRDGIHDTSINGLIQYDNAWFFLRDGVVDISLEGFVDYDGSKFYVANGQVCSNYSGLVLDNNAWYFIADGKFQGDYSGFAEYQGEWFVLENGLLNTGYNGLYDYNGGQFVIAAGRLVSTYTGLFQASDGWYFIANGQVQSAYSGLVSYDNAWFVLENGSLDSSYTGLYDYDGATFLVNSGQVMSGYSGNYESGANRYLVVGGQITNIVPYTHSQAEIRAYYNAYPYNPGQAVTYAEEPSLKNDYAGFLSPESLQDGLNAVNFMRYIAGIPNDVSLKSECSRYAQDACFVLAKNNTGLSHSPSNTSNIPSSLFKSGYTGASSSNLGMGYTNVSNSVIYGYMNDGDSFNIDRVGHRRWILSPGMKNIGFGYCNGYTATYVFDQSRQDYDIDYIAWPAENTPVEVFSGPWSLLLSGSKYSGDLSNVQVTMTDIATGKSWSFNRQTNNNPNLINSPYFNADTGGYGYMNALIFHPGTTFSANSAIKVDVSGLKDVEGNAASISYVVSFFSL